jgi:polar amino acid transport system substrate-binding protein
VKLSGYFALYSIILQLSILNISPTAHAETLLLVADEWCPYNCDPDSANPGFMVEITQRVFQKEGHTVKYLSMPWSRAVTTVRSGLAHGLIGVNSEETPDLIYPEIEQGLSIMAFYTRKEIAWFYTGLKSLDLVTIGAIKHYSYGEPVDQYIKDHSHNSSKVELLSTNGALKLNIKKLLAGRITVIPEDRWVFRHVVGSFPQAHRLKEVGVISRKPHFIAFSPKLVNANLYARILTEGTQQLREQGALKKILKKYDMKDWRPDQPSIPPKKIKPSASFQPSRRK